MLPDALKEQIVSAVDSRQEEIIALLQRRIQIESVIGHEERVQEYLASEWRHLGLVVDQFEPDLAALAVAD